MKVKVILKDEVQGLGYKGDIVEVAKGYADNFLFPKQVAVRATTGELNKLERVKEKEKKKEESKRSEFEKIKKELDGKTFKIKMKAGEGEKLFGSVTNKEIMEIMSESDIKIDKRKIILEEPIKKLGNFKVKIKLLNDIEAEININVEKESEDK